MRADVASRAACANQRGALLIEALVAILLFSIGVLGLVGMQGFAIGAVRDAHYRSEASYLANQFVGLMWTYVDRRTPDAARDTFCAFAMGAAGTASASPGCVGAASVNPAIEQAKSEWLRRVSAALPNADAASQRVEVDAVEGKRVVVTLSWRAPQDVAPRRHVVTANVN